MRISDGRHIMVIGRKGFATPTTLPVEEDARISELRIVVLYTTPELTRRALRYAEKLGHGLSMNLSLVDIQVVPFLCPLDRPPIDPEFSRRRLEALVEGRGVSMRAELVYARDRDEALTKLLGPGSLVLIPVKGFFGRMCEGRLMRKLKKHGHDVVLVPCK